MIVSKDSRKEIQKTVPRQISPIHPYNVFRSDELALEAARGDSENQNSERTVF